MPTTRRRQKQLKQEKQQQERQQNNKDQESLVAVTEVQQEQKKKPRKKQKEINLDTDSQQQPLPPKKPKPPKPPKKYLKKSVEQRARINRSKHQRIFLLTAARAPESWSFRVQGTKGSQYTVIVSTEVHCTCTDFRIQRRPCKHIYFIVTQVGQNDELLDYFRSDGTIAKKAYKILDDQLSNRLKSRLQKPTKDPKEIDLKDDLDCVICFTEMDKNTEPLEDCSTCRKYFHSQCLEAWKGHNPSCPLCRGLLTGERDGGDGRGQRDPLSKVIDIKM